MTRVRVLALVVLAALALTAAAVVLWWPTGRARPTLPTARTYRDVDVCLLTDAQGVGAGAPAGPAWAGVRAAADRRQVRASYLQAFGPDTQANAVPYLNTLLQQHCSVVVAAGAAEVGAVRAQAAKHPSVHFVVVGDGLSAGNVAGVPAGRAGVVADRVRDLVAASAG